MPKEQLTPEVIKLHQAACKAEEVFYTDPATGLMVQTEYAHKERGHCCESGCRHCPYGYDGGNKRE